MTHPNENPEIANSDDLRFYFRKANGGIGSIPVPPVPKDAAAAAEYLADFTVTLIENGHDLVRVATRSDFNPVAGRQDSFNDVSGLSPEQIFELRLSQFCIIFGEGPNQLILPKDTPPENIRAVTQVWFENQGAHHERGYAPEPSQ